MTGSSSENEEGSGKWEWDGKNWWFRVDHRGPVNSRLTRKISRVAKATIDETKKWGDELFQLRSRVEWLETEKQRAQQYKTWVGDAPGIQAPGMSSQESGVSQNSDFGIFMRPHWWKAFHGKCSLLSVLNDPHSCGRHAGEACGCVVLKRRIFKLIRTVFMSPPAGRWRRLAPWAP